MTAKIEKVKVFLSDPQVLFREGIHFILSGEDDFEVTGETTNNEEAFNLIQANPPQIAILSLQDPKAEGCDITRRIRRNLPSTSVILIIDTKDEAKLFETVKCGASACITKDADPEYLLDIIRVVAQGSYPIIDELLKAGVASKILTEFADVATINVQMDNMMAGLTPKETQVLTAIAAGSAIEQVAAKLDMSEDIIRRNLKLVLNKLVSNDQSRAVFEAAQRSLPSLLRASLKKDNGAEYVTKAEFNDFKEALFSRFKTIISEKP